MSRKLASRQRRKVALLKKPGVTRATALADAVQTQGNDVASASIISLTVGGGTYVRVTGTTTINGIAEQPAGQRRLVVFADVLTLTHNSTSLILPGGVNITTYAGYTAEFLSLGGGNWRMLGDNAVYQPLDATLTALAGLTISANTMIVGTGTDAFSMLSVSANTFPARSSSGDIAAKTITDFGLSLIDDAASSNARTTLGLVIGTDVQAYDATLAAFAALTIAANSLTIGTGADAFSQTSFAANTFPARASTGNLVAKTITDFGLSLVDDAASSDARTTLGLVIGTDVQAYDATLAALAGLTIAANSLTIGTGADAFSQTTFAANTFPARASTGNLVAKDITDFGLSLVDDSDAATARTTLGLVIGTNVQAYDADLTTWAGLTPSANAQSLVTAANYAAMRALLDLEAGTDFYSIAAADAAFQPKDATLTALAGLTIAANSLTIGTGADAFSQTTFAANTFPARASTGDLVAKAITDFGLSLVDDADAATARTTLGLVIGTNVQAYDAELAALAGLTSAADKGIMFTGSGTAAVYTLTSFALTLLDDTTAVAVLTTLGLSANGQSLVTAANYAAMRALLDLEAGTDFLGYPTGTPTGAKFLRDDNSWQAIPGGGDALTTSPLSQFAATTSAQLRGVLSDETGSGAAVFADTPTLVTPVLGTPTSGTLTNCDGTASSLIAGKAVVLNTARTINGVSFDGSANVTTHSSSDASVTISGADAIVNANWIAGTPLINGYLSCSVSGNALTIAIKAKSGSDPSSSEPVKIAFRNATIGTGDYTVISLTGATSLVISSGSTLSTANSTPFRFWVVGFNDGGTFRIGVVNCKDMSGNGLNMMKLRDDMLASSTAEGGAGGADTYHVIYTGSAVTSKAIRILGYIDYTTGLATAGAYSGPPDKVQSFGLGVSLPGQIVKSYHYATEAQNTGTTTIPADDTIPQNTEGTEFMSVAFVPSESVNVLDIQAKTYLSRNAAPGIVVAALFQDSTANALASAWQNVISNQGAFYTMLNHMMLAGTSSSTTFKIRAGGEAASTTYFNGNSAGRYFGGTMYSYIRITEIMG